MAAGLTLAGRLLETSSERDQTWVDYLKARIDPSWRPGEFDFESLVLRPAAGSRDNALTTCIRAGCGVHLFRGRYCAVCRKEYYGSGSTLPIDQWLAQAGLRVRAHHQDHCDVKNCARSHAARGLCQSHVSNYLLWTKKKQPDWSVPEWIAARSPKPFPAAPKCRVNCDRDVAGKLGLCTVHARSYADWKIAQAPGATAIDLWISRHSEPHNPAEEGGTFAEQTATAFGLLPEPARWELLFATQQRDREGKMLNATILRSLYRSVREVGATSVVGLKGLGVDAQSKTRRGLANTLQREIDEAHRTWSGVDHRDSRIIWLRDVALRPGARTIGHKAMMDLRSIRQEWIVEAINAWVNETPRGLNTAKTMEVAWVVAAAELDLRGTPVDSLGGQDIDAVVQAIRTRWESRAFQRRTIAAVRDLLAYARDRSQFEATWGVIPGSFSIDKARHQANGSKLTASTGDEPFRFVPQPIIEHLMNNLDLLVRKGGPYQTAEARAMIYVHERCGRRTSETTKLEDDCISYDDAGAPYLEWNRGKPPYTRGPRLPIHQETHDVIRQWQDIKREHGVTSKWLYPKTDSNSSVDKHWNGDYLGSRLKELVDAIEKQAPLTEPVEGVNGNLVYFDLRSIDPYSLRHAFAQRYADATDANGNSTTQPDVLQDLMGHLNFTTTMAYYEVSAKRRKRALNAVPARRLNLHGEVVTVDRERDGFTKVAVTLGHCTEPQNVSAHGHGCMIDHACESCPFFLADPLERDGMEAKRHHLRVQLERARAINAQQHLLDHYEARIKDSTTIINGIDAYIDALPEREKAKILEALNSMAEVRRLAVAPRIIDLRAMFAAEATA